MKVGVIQPFYPHGQMTPEKVMQDIIDTIRSIEVPLDLVVTPEYTNCPGLSNKDEILSHCEKYSRAFIEEVKALAKAKNTNIAVNVLLTQERRILTNTTILIDHTDLQRAEYNKTHLTEAEKQLGIVPGNCPVTYQLGNVRLAFATCFDIYFAEYMEMIASLKPDIIIFPSYQRSESSDVIAAQARGRALDMEAFILRSSYSMGNESSRGGCSMIVDPGGSILVNAKQRTGLFIDDIHPERKRRRPAAYDLPEVTSRDIIEKNRRPELYRSTMFSNGMGAD